MPSEQGWSTENKTRIVLWPAVDTAFEAPGALRHVEGILLLQNSNCWVHYEQPHLGMIAIDCEILLQLLWLETDILLECQALHHDCLDLLGKAIEQHPKFLIMYTWAGING